MSKEKSEDYFFIGSNKIVDNILSHPLSTDLSAVFMYLSRWMYGTSGELTLLNDFSPKNICKAIFKSENTRRLTRAFKALEQIGFLKYNLKYGNTVTLEIIDQKTPNKSAIESQGAAIESQGAAIESQDAAIESQDAAIESQDAAIESQDAANIISGEEDLGWGGDRILQGGGGESYRGSERILQEGVEDSSERSNIINDKKRLINHHKKVDNDLLEIVDHLINRYEEKLLKYVTPNQKETLIRNLTGKNVSEKYIEYLENCINRLANHPHTKKCTNSINTIFHTDHMFTKDEFKHFHKIALEMISSDIEITEIEKTVKESDYCVDTFKSYYQIAC